MLTWLKNKTVWKLALLLALGLAALLGAGARVEWMLYRLGSGLTPRHPPNPQVTVVAIDEDALDKYGPWPWPRSRLAALVDGLTADKAQVIALAIDLSAPQNAEALGYLDQIQQLSSAASSGTPEPLAAKIEEARRELATDAALAQSLARAGNVVLAAPGERNTDAKAVHATGVDAVALPLAAPSAPDVVPHLPLADFVHASRGVGYLDLTDMTTYQMPLLVRDGNDTLPSFALLTAARVLGVETGDIRAHKLGGLELGTNRISTDRYMQVLLRSVDGGLTVPVYGYNDVVSGGVPADRFAGKTVLVGEVTSDGASPVLRAARVVSGLLNDDLVSAPYWVWGVRALAMLLIVAYLLFLLPRLSLVLGSVASVLLLLLLLNGEFIPLLAQARWLPLALPIAVLVLGHILMLVLQFVHERTGVSRGALSEAKRELGLAYQALGRYDQALDCFEACLPSKMLCDNLMALGQEHERGRRYIQAIEVYACLQRIAPAWPGLENRLERLRQIESNPTLTRAPRNAALARALSDGSLQKPVLGRYEIVKELGRGAMGVVYLGRDAKIGRQVAIKTMSLADEFDTPVLKDISERFFREAETAGRLNHPNIVTVYDVGEDQGLAYIAMDYLSGEPLQKYASAPNLLPLDEVLGVVTRVAEALAYAHSKNVVHRDIKPANILYERGTGQLKITDFGVAGLTDLSRTKTGTILGSPSYMSPEQVAGKRVDGRSDLYSLGVTFYQLLRGDLPFEAASLTGLMFKIANEPAPDVTFLRPDIPNAVRAIVDRALQKNPDARYQSGTEMAEALRQCQASLKRAR